MEKWKFNLTVLVLILIATGISNAGTDWDIYQDETINSGDYATVSIYDSLDDPPIQTTVTMTAGDAVGIKAYNTSVFNLYDGNIGTYGLYTYNSSTANIYGWSDGLKIVATDSSIVNIFQGNATGNLNAYSNSTVHIYGKDLAFNAPSSSGYLTGTWADETAFSLYIRGESELPTQIILHEIPEPATLLLFVLGGFMIRKNSKFSK